MLILICTNLFKFTYSEKRYNEGHLIRGMYITGSVIYMLWSDAVYRNLVDDCQNFSTLDQIRMQQLWSFIIIHYTTLWIIMGFVTIYIVQFIIHCCFDKNKCVEEDEDEDEDEYF